jgi:hypothetical protein
MARLGLWGGYILNIQHADIPEGADGGGLHGGSPDGCRLQK